MAEYSNWREVHTPLGRAVACEFEEVGYAPYTQTMLVASANDLLAHGFVSRADLDAAVADDEGDMRYVWVILGDFDDLSAPVCAPYGGEHTAVPAEFGSLLDDESFHRPV